jgi:hypothetical protein
LKKIVRRYASSVATAAALSQSVAPSATVNSLSGGKGIAGLRRSSAMQSSTEFLAMFSLKL